MNFKSIAVAAALSLAAAGAAQASTTFNLVDLGTFEAYSTANTGQTYTGDGFVGMYNFGTEEFARDCAFTLYTWRKVVLNTHRRTREFDRGVLLMDGDGNTITPQLDMPARGSRRRPGSKAWRELRTDTNIQTFDVETAQEFIDTSERFRQHVLRNDNS